MAQLKCVLINKVKKKLKLKLNINVYDSKEN